MCFSSVKNLLDYIRGRLEQCASKYAHIEHRDETDTLLQKHGELKDILKVWDYIIFL